MRTLALLAAGILFTAGCQSKLIGKWQHASTSSSDNPQLHKNRTLRFNSDSTVSMTEPGGDAMPVQQKYLVDEDVIVFWGRDPKTGKFRSSVTQYSITNNTLILFSPPEHRQEFERVK